MSDLQDFNSPRLCIHPESDDLPTKEVVVIQIGFSSFVDMIGLVECDGSWTGLAIQMACVAVRIGCKRRQRTSSDRTFSRYGVLGMRLIVGIPWAIDRDDHHGSGTSTSA